MVRVPLDSSISTLTLRRQTNKQDQWITIHQTEDQWMREEKECMSHINVDGVLDQDTVFLNSKTRARMGQQLQEWVEARSLLCVNVCWHGLGDRKTERKHNSQKNKRVMTGCLNVTGWGTGKLADACKDLKDCYFDLVSTSEYRHLRDNVWRDGSEYTMTGKGQKKQEQNLGVAWPSSTEKQETWRRKR